MLSWWRWWQVFVLGKTQGICNPDYRNPSTSKVKSTQHFLQRQGMAFFNIPHVFPSIMLIFEMVPTMRSACSIASIMSLFDAPLLSFVKLWFTRKVSSVWLEVSTGRIVHCCPDFALRSVSCLHLSSYGVAGVLSTLCAANLETVLIPSWTGIRSEHYLNWYPIWALFIMSWQTRQVWRKWRQYKLTADAAAAVFNLNIDGGGAF